MRRPLRFHHAVVVVFTALTSAAAAFADSALSAAERTALNYVDGYEPQALQLLQEIVDINSGTMNFSGVRKVGETLRPHFEALGFKVRWEDGAAFGRAGHLIAERAGRGPRVLLIGHLDTVFEPDHPFQRFEKLDEHTARGPGTADMKGGLIVGLAALGALRQAGALDDLHITFVMHGDEEDSGAPLEAARATLINAAKNADIAIGLENADDDPATAVTARRSSGSWEVKVTGRSAHSSQIFMDEVGAGAVYELARILNAFYDELGDEPHLTFNPGLISGGVQLEYTSEPLGAKAAGKTNIVVPQAIAAGDLRALTPEQIRNTQERMRKIVAAHLPHTSAQISFDESYPPMAPTEGNRRLLALYDEVSRDLGFGPVTAVDPRRAGAADVSFAAGHVDMAIDGLGLLGGDSHTPDEYADLRTYRVQAQRLALLLLRLGRR